MPVVFEPIFKPKPWGGRELARLFAKQLPPYVPIGESWELADLPGNESRVARGPLAGTKLSELIEMWGRGLLGDAELLDGRFPLLIKFLDARERLSIQVHPRPRGDALKPEYPGVKHEAWYVIDADPGAALHIGLKPGVGPTEVRAAGSTPALAELHQPRAAEPGRCYYLPSGVPHALGAGIVVAEVQTPSDVTYRLYDWNRLGLDGQPRELHVEQALANIRYDVSEESIIQPRAPSDTAEGEAERLVSCERFVMDLVRFDVQHAPALPHGELAVWIVLSGDGVLASDRDRCDFKSGDVVLIPAESGNLSVRSEVPSKLLEVRVPSIEDAAGTSA
jgi:mannose-6-phosphate isomerase